MKIMKYFAIIIGTLALALLILPILMRPAFTNALEPSANNGQAAISRYFGRQEQQLAEISPRAGVTLNQSVTNMTTNVGPTTTLNGVRRTHKLHFSTTIATGNPNFSANGVTLTTTIPAQSTLESVQADGTPIPLTDLIISEENQTTHTKTIYFPDNSWTNVASKKLDVYVTMADNPNGYDAYKLATNFAGWQNGVSFALKSNDVHVNMFIDPNFSLSEVVNNVTTGGTPGTALTNVARGDQLHFVGIIADKAPKFIGHDMTYSMTIPSDATVNSAMVDSRQIAADQYTVSEPTADHVRTVTFKNLTWTGLNRKFDLNVTMNSSLERTYKLNTTATVKDLEETQYTQKSPDVSIAMKVLPAPDLKISVKKEVKRLSDAPSAYTDKLIVDGGGLLIYRFTIKNESASGDQNIWYAPNLTDKLEDGISWTSGGQDMSHAFNDLAPGESQTFEAPALLLGANGVNHNVADISGLNNQTKPADYQSNEATVSYGNFAEPDLTHIQTIEDKTQLESGGPTDHLSGAKNGDTLEYVTTIQNKATHSVLKDTNFSMLIPLKAAIDHIIVNGNPLSSSDYQLAPINDDPLNQQIIIPNLAITGTAATTIVVQIKTSRGFVQVGTVYTHQSTLIGTSGMETAVTSHSNKVILDGFTPGFISLAVQDLSYGPVDLNKVTTPMTFDQSGVSASTPVITINDQRNEKGPTTLSVTQSSPFKDVSTQLESQFSSLAFTDFDSDSTQPLVIGAPTTVLNIKTEDASTSQAFPVGKGVRLVQQPGATRTGNYKTTLEWTLVSGP